jgi:polygalacturonase
VIALLSILGLASVPFDIRDYGAIGDGITLSTSAIQKAIDSAASGGRGVVRIPAGTYLTGSIHLRSHVEIHLDLGAILLGSSRRKDYDRGRWFSLVLAEKLSDIAITGAGTIDGQGKALAQDVLRMVETGEVKIPPKGWRPSEVDRPQILEIQDCQRVRIEGVTIKNSSCWVQTYRNCSHLTIRGIHVDSKTYWNNDGIDVVDCKGVQITDCDVDAADDGICLKSESPAALCEDVLIENCRVRSSASAVKFGTASTGGFRNVHVKGISVRDTYRSAIALESVDGGALENVLVENIRAVNTGNAFFIRLGHRNLHVPPGRVRHVILRDLDVQVPIGQPDKGYPFQGPPFLEPHNLAPSSIVGHRDVPIEDVLLANIKIRFGGGGSKDLAFRAFDQVPERPSDYPDFTMFGELPAWAIYVRHVKGLKVHGLSVTLDARDYRPAFVFDDVDGVSLGAVSVSGVDLKPTIVTRSVGGLRLPAGFRRIDVSHSSQR